MGLFKESGTDIIKRTYFLPEEKLYIPLLKRLGITPTGDCNECTLSDYVKYKGNACEVILDKKENILHIVYETYCIVDVRTKERIIETIYLDEADKKRKTLHDRCISNGDEIEYASEFWRGRERGYTEMVYPFTFLEIDRFIKFDLKNVQINIDKDKITFCGNTKEELYEILEVSDKQGYQVDTLVDEKYTYNEIEIDNVYKNGQGKRLDKALKKYGAKL